jgi:hypothetical protein
MLEVFVFSMCLKGNPPACESAGSAYYKQSGIEQVVSKREKEYILKYPVMASLLAYTAAAAQVSQLSIWVMVTLLLLTDASLC